MFLYLKIIIVEFFGIHPPKEKLNLTVDKWNKLFHINNGKKKYIKIILKNVSDKLYNIINTI